MDICAVKRNKKLHAPELYRVELYRDVSIFYLPHIGKIKKESRWKFRICEQSESIIIVKFVDLIVYLVNSHKNVSPTNNYITYKVHALKIHISVA